MLYFQRILEDGGPMMWVILAFSVLALFLILERLFHLHRAQIDVQEFIHGLFNVLRRNNVVEAVAICDETPGPVAHVLRAAILQSGKNEPTIRKAVDEVTLVEIPRLERHMRLLYTLAHVAPLLGLLGTVVGMIHMFDTMQQAGEVFVGTLRLADDVKEALYTSAAGLSVCIPACMFHNYLLGRIEALTVDMQTAASEMIYFLTHNAVSLDQADKANEGGPDGDDADADA